MYILDRKGVALSRSMLDRYRINPVTYGPVFQAMVFFLFKQGIISMDRTIEIISEISNETIQVAKGNYQSGRLFSQAE